MAYGKDFKPAALAEAKCRRFARLFRRLAVPIRAAEAFAELTDKLAEPHRAYHNAKHVDACLRCFDGVRERFAEPDEAEFALWFHDAHYDPRAKDNEERSAAWAAKLLPPGPAERVAALILATTHDAPPHSGDCELVLDIDLAILGAPPAEFAAYGDAIRREYSWVPDAQYRTGRAAVLRGFLDRPAIFRTERLRASLETRARTNLAEALARLGASGW